MASLPNLSWRAAADGAFGVIAEEAIGAGTLLERCYCLPLQRCSVPGDELRSWLYDVGDSGELLFPFGWGLLYNDADGDEANVTWQHELDASGSGYISLRTHVDVSPGEELRVRGPNARRDVLARAASGCEAAASAVSSRDCVARADGVDASSGGLSSARFCGVTELRPSPLHGNGVFAARAIAQGELIEIAPELLATRWQLGHCLVDHRFQAGDGAVSLGLWLRVALGLGSVFNHADEPNLSYSSAGTAQRPLTSYRALRDIAEGEELFISYGAAWWASRKDAQVSLGEWRLRRGETRFGRPFYDDPSFEAKAGLKAAMVEKLHRAFVDAEEGDSSPLKAWKSLCERLRSKADIQGWVNAPLRESGERATHTAAKLGQAEKLKWLVLNGADVNAATAPALDLSSDGTASSALRPVHLAAIYGRIEVLIVLQSAGADLNSRRTDGATALDFAKDTEQAEAEFWLKARGAVHGIL